MVDCVKLARQVRTCGTATSEHKQEARIKIVMVMCGYGDIISQNSAIRRERFQSHHLTKRCIETIREQSNGSVNNLFLKATFFHTT